MIRGRWLGLAAAIAAITLTMSVSARAADWPRKIVRTVSLDSIQLVGNGVYPATTSKCFATTEEADIPMNPTSGQTLTAPIVVGVFWPGAQSPDPLVHTLFGDFVTDVLNGPFWDATMPQYVGSAHGVFSSSVDLTTLLTLTPSTTVESSTIATELLAQVRAGVLPAPDPQVGNTLPNTIYVVHFPPGVSITDPTIGTSCVDYCGYHDNHVDFSSSPPLLAWIVMPDFSQNAGCQAGCSSGTPFEEYTHVLAHELLETATDPYATGWINTCSKVLGGEEIADVCEQYKFYVPRRTSSPGTPQYVNQWVMSSVFSNQDWNPSNANGCFVTDATQQDTPTATPTATPSQPPSPTPEDGGFVPPDTNTDTCEDMVAAHLKQLAKCLVTCQIKQANSRLKSKPFDEATCEAGSGKPVSCRAAYDKASTALLGLKKPMCPACLDAAALSSLADTVTTFVQGTNSQVYCDGTVPFGGAEGGFVPPDMKTGTCENTVARHLKGLLGCQTKCQIKQADTALYNATHSKPKVFDEEACEQGSGKPVSCRTAYNNATTKLLGRTPAICPACLAATAQSNLADLAAHFVENNNGLIYCAGTTPLP